MNNPVNKPDIELLESIKQNNSRSLEVLFRKYYRGLCDFSNSILNDRELSQEAVADVFLNIWLKRGRIKIRSSFRAYLYTAVKNQSVNYLKKNKQNLDQLEVADKENTSASLSADDFLLYDELSDKIEKILRELPEKRQQIFRMNRIDGLSYAEIAEVLSISIHTVQNQMVKAVKYISEQQARINLLLLIHIFQTNRN